MLPGPTYDDRVTAPHPRPPAHIVIKGRALHKAEAAPAGRQAGRQAAGPKEQLGRLAQPANCCPSHLGLPFRLQAAIASSAEASALEAKHACHACCPAHGPARSGAGPAGGRCAHHLRGPVRPLGGMSTGCQRLTSTISLPAGAKSSSAACRRQDKAHGGRVGAERCTRPQAQSM